MRKQVSELEGPALDWAAGMATEAWKSAHELFPTWTLDATFSGIQAMVYSDGQAFCQLVPNNPMRQDPQRYSPTTDWAQGGPLIDRYKPDLTPICNDSGWCAEYDVPMPGGDDADTFSVNGPTALIAAMRSIVAAELGDTVDIPEALCTE